MHPNAASASSIPGGPCAHLPVSGASAELSDGSSRTSPGAESRLDRYLTIGYADRGASRRPRCRRDVMSRNPLFRETGSRTSPRPNNSTSACKWWPARLAGVAALGGLLAPRRVGDFRVHPGHGFRRGRVRFRGGADGVRHPRGEPAVQPAMPALIKPATAADSSARPAGVVKNRRRAARLARRITRRVGDEALLRADHGSP